MWDAKPGRLVTWDSPRDAGSIALTERLAFPHTSAWSASRYRAFRRRPTTRGLVAIDDGQVVGHMLWNRVRLCEIQTADVATFAVRYEYRRQGVATALFGALKHRLRGHSKCNTLRCFVDEYNDAAIAFLQSVGMVALGSQCNVFCDREDHLAHIMVWCGERMRNEQDGRGKPGAVARLR